MRRITQRSRRQGWWIGEINLFRPARECRRKKTFFSGHRLEYGLTVSMCRRLRHNAMYLISSPSSSASIAAEIAARCLPWAQRRQLLIYRDRTTEPLTPASTRSIPIAIVILSASHGPLCLPPSRPIPAAFTIEFAPKWIYRCYRGIGRFLPEGSPKGSRMGLQAPPTMPEPGLGYAYVYAYARTHCDRVGFIYGTRRSRKRIAEFTSCWFVITRELTLCSPPI